MTTNNEAFEKWFALHEGLSEYSANAGWQAATTEANKRIKELESKVAELKEDLIELRQQTNIRCAQVQERDAKIYELQASNNHLREALDMLVITKEYKDKQGKDAVYETMRTNAWNVAEQALSTTPAQSLQAHDDELIEDVISVIEKYRGFSGLEVIEAIRALKGQ